MDKTKKKYDYLIVGAGLFGAVFAAEAVKKEKKCLVIDRRPHIGGNVYTEERKGIHVHRYGAHIFHTSNQMVWGYVNQYAEFQRFVNAPIAFYKDEVYNMPFNMNTFSKLWGVRTPEEARQKIEEERKKCQLEGEPANLEEQAKALVGEDIYIKLIEGYTRKQWGKSPKELPAFIIKRLPLRFTYDNNYFNDTYQGIPAEGYTKLVQRLLEGAELQLSKDYLADREYWETLAEKVIYTGMIDEYYDYCYGALEYRSLRFEEEEIDTDNYQGNAVINYTDYEVPYTRVIEHKHFLKGQQKETIITREYPQEWSKGMEPYYPVNDEKNTRLYGRYKERMEQEKSVIFGGRLAEYKYYDMDKVIERALFVAKGELG